MAVKLVQIVNPNGRKGWVAETSRAAEVYKRPPSTRTEQEPGDGDGLPAKNASTETWRAYATAHGMSAEDADQMSRDDVVAHYESEED